MEYRLPASDEVIGHIVAMHLPRVASNEVPLGSNFLKTFRESKQANPANPDAQ
jgi:hypothetical protein